jgi:hypothetical protein
MPVGYKLRFPPSEKAQFVTVCGIDSDLELLGFSPLAYCSRMNIIIIDDPTPLQKGLQTQPAGREDTKYAKVNK